MLLLGAAAFERGAPARWTASSAWATVYLAVFGTALPFVGLFWLIRRVPVSVIGTIPVVDTVIAVLLGSLVLHEALSPRVLAGERSSWRASCWPPRRSAPRRLPSRAKKRPRMASVTFTDVEKRYGDVPVIDRLNLEVRDREFMVLVGPSGSGKSTALRMIAGLEEISSGTIAIDGRTVNEVAPRDRNIAMVFQNYALYPHMSVKENLAFGLRLRKTPAAGGRAPRQRDRQNARDLRAARPQAEAALRRRAPARRGGPRDHEETRGLPVRRAPVEPRRASCACRCAPRSRSSRTRFQTTAIYVTHDQTEAMTMGSRIAVMKDGRLQQVGAPIEVYRRPQNVFVAGFIGNLPMNLVAATLEDRGRRVAAAGFSVASPEPFVPAPGADGRRVILGMRPEDLRGPAAAGAAARISIQVEVCEPIGNEVVVHGRAGNDALVCVHGADRVPEPGDRLDVAVDLGRVHLFDAATGDRI